VMLNAITIAKINANNFFINIFLSARMNILTFSFRAKKKPYHYSNLKKLTFGTVRKSTRFSA